MTAGYDGSIKIDSKIDSKGFNAGLKSMTASLKGLAAAIGLAFGGAAVVAFGRSAIKAASDMASALAGLQFVLRAQGREFAGAQKFIQDYISDGLVPATDAIAAYKNLLARGYDDSQIKSLLTVMKDAAVYNRQASFSIGDAIQKASEGLRNENSLLTDSVGITKNVAKMWDEFAKSIGTTANNLTLAQKRQAEVNGFMAEGAIFAGAAASYSSTYAGKVSALVTSFENLKVALGNSILPVMAQIIPKIKAAVDMLTVLFNTYSQFVQAFFGVDASATMAAVEAANAAADAQNNLADATENAQKAAKGSLAAFDELNVLQQPDKAPAAEAATSSAADGGELPGLGISDETINKVQTLKDRLIEFFQPLKDWVSNEAAPAFLDLLAAGATVLDEALVALEPLGTWLWEEFLVPLGEWAGDKIIELLDGLTKKLADLAEWIRANPEDFRTMTTIILGFFAAWKVGQLGVSVALLIGHLARSSVALFTNTAAWIANTAAKIAGKVETLAIAALLAGDFLRNLASSTLSLIKNTAAWVASTAAKGAAAVAQIALNVATGIWNGLAVIASAVTWAFGAAVAFLTSPVGLVILAIVALIAIVVLLIKNWDWVKEKAGQVWDWIVEKWGQAKDWFSTNIAEPLKDAFGDALDWIGEKWEGIFTGVSDFVKGSINSIIDLINGLIDAYVNGLNSIIGGLNSLQVTIPDWVPSYGGSTWGLSIPLLSAPQIPRLATGAVIPPNSEFLAVLGDQRTGRNIETPETLMRQIVREEMQLQGPQEIRVRFEGTLAQFVRELKPVIEFENSRVGSSLVKG